MTEPSLKDKSWVWGNSATSSAQDNCERPQCYRMVDSQVEPTHHAFKELL